jgi:hypothetical protein
MTSTTKQILAGLTGILSGVVLVSIIRLTLGV